MDFWGWPLTDRCPRRLRWGGWAVGVAAVGAAAVWVAWGAHPQVAHAQGEATDDADGDGLPDGLELVLGTRADLADTDGDGWVDAEEIARHSSPVRALSLPDPAKANEIAVSTDAFLAEGQIHVVTSVFLPEGRAEGQHIRFWTIHDSGIVPVPWSALAGGVAPRLVNAGVGPGVVIVLDPLLNEQRVLSANGFSLAAVVSKLGVRCAADACNLSIVDNEIFQRLAINAQTLVPNPAPAVGLGVGGVYRPIGTSTPGSGNGGGGGGNPSYSVGEICAQTTVIVGVVGALVTQEVIAADCVSGWDAHCSAGCSATVGTTIKTIDPAALIGG